MLTNFSHKYKHISKGTMVTYIEEIVEANNALNLTDSTELTPTTHTPEPAIDVNPSLPSHKQEQIKGLL